MYRRYIWQQKKYVYRRLFNNRSIFVSEGYLLIKVYTYIRSVYLIFNRFIRVSKVWFKGCGFLEVFSSPLLWKCTLLWSVPWIYILHLIILPGNIKITHNIKGKCGKLKTVQIGKQCKRNRKSSKLYIGGESTCL